MNTKNLPYWLKGGVVAGLIGTFAFILFPDKFIGNEVPWYLGWAHSLAFMIFAPLALLSKIDFVSEAASLNDRTIASIISGFSFFVVFFMVGVLAAVIIKKIKMSR